METRNYAIAAEKPDLQASGHTSSNMPSTWMQRTMTPRMPHHALNANQMTSIAAMIAYIASRSGQSEFRVERNLSDQFKIPNPKFLPADHFDDAIRYLADIISTRS